VFGRCLCALAREDSRICAVTAAMRDGTGLAPFGEEFPQRLFDVGIAEEHAVTFACGLARAGMRPAVALYSTFSQRVFDQVLHDAALQKLPLTLLLDRAGIVAGDGVTHQGLFDVGLFSPIPGVEIFAPLSFRELEEMLPRAIESPMVSVIRYPRGGEVLPEALFQEAGEGISFADFGEAGPSVTILSYGRPVAQAVRAAQMLSAEYRVHIVRLSRLWPLDASALHRAVGDSALCIIAEEGMRRGGVGEAVAALLGEVGGCPTRILGVEDFVPHGDTETLLARLSLDGDGIARAVREYFSSTKTV